MRKAEVFMHGQKAGVLIEEEKNRRYQFIYEDDYDGPPVSVTMPLDKREYRYDHFPSFFEGLLPEGVNLEMLLRSKKIDRDDPFSQLMAVGEDTVGAVTVR
ncbi:MAG TPA: HipA N-terminal domain-containing protein, partial [Balneolales bacterium]|nr:HipA N-terminal domain-containing protein [Balneolales bacterium]